MKPEEILRFFNFVSIFFGVGIFLKNPLIKIINLIRSIMVIAFSLCSMYNTIPNTGQRETTVFWITLMDVFYFTSQAVNTGYCFCKSNEFRRIITKLSPVLSNKQQLKMFLVSNILAFILLVHYVCFALSYLGSDTKSHVLTRLWIVFKCYLIASFTHLSFTCSWSRCLPFVIKMF